MTSAFGELAAYLDVLPGEGCDLQSVPVDEPFPVDPDVGVVAGSYDVAGSGVVPVGELDPRFADLSRGSEFGLDNPGQFGRFGVGAREEERVFPGEEVSQVLTGGPGVGGFVVAVPDPAVGVVGREHLAVGLAQPQGRGSLPLCTEAEHLVQLDRSELPGDGAEHAARFDRAKLVQVTGGDHVSADAASGAEDQGQVGGGQHRRLVEDQDVTGAELTG